MSSEMPTTAVGAGDDTAPKPGGMPEIVRVSEEAGLYGLLNGIPHEEMLEACRAARRELAAKAP